jgi:hypothetical protein
MKKLTNLIGILTTLGLMFITTIPVYAQSSTSQAVLHAEIDRNNITTDDTIILTVTVDMFESGLSSPQLPALDGFQIVSQNNSSQISMVNGDMTVQEIYQYYLRPENVGNIIIDPITLTIHGTVYSTEPIIVNVSQGTGKLNPPPKPSSPSFPNFPNFPSLNSIPSLGFDIPLGAEPMDPSLAPEGLTGRDYFLEAEVDKSNAYQGEQIQYILRFYKATSPISGLELTQPSFSGFWHKSAPEEKHFSLSLGSKKYLVTELQSILFPTVVGDIEIEPAQITIPDNFFSTGGSLQTSPIHLYIKPLPAGAPDSFNGAIGKFKVTVEVDSTEINVNEPINYRFMVKGKGNVENIPEPDWNEGSTWRSFDTTVETSTQFENGFLVGTKVFERLLVPTQSGHFRFPSLEFSYFDPDEGTYSVINTDQIEVNVKSDGSESALASQIPDTNIYNNDNSGNKEFISSIKTKPVDKIIGNKELFSSPVFWFIWIIPLLLLTGHLAWEKNIQRNQKDTDYRRYKNASKKAFLALEQLEENPDSGSVERIFLEYLSDKLNKPFSGFTLEELEEELLRLEIKEKRIAQIRTCIMLNTMGMYSPGSESEIQMEALKLVKDLIKILEKEI